MVTLFLAIALSVPDPAAMRIGLHPLPAIDVAGATAIAIIEADELIHDRVAVRIVVRQRKGGCRIYNPYHQAEKATTCHLLGFSSEGTLLFVRKTNEPVVDKSKQIDAIELFADSGIGREIILKDVKNLAFIQAVFLQALIEDRQRDIDLPADLDLKHYEKLLGDQLLAITELVPIVRALPPHESAGTSPANNPLRLWISKPEFVVGEQVELRASYINRLDSACLVPRPLDSGRDGETAPRLVLVENGKPQPGDLLESLAWSRRPTATAYYVPPQGVVESVIRLRAGTIPGTGYIAGNPNVGKYQLCLADVTMVTLTADTKLPASLKRRGRVDYWKDIDYENVAKSFTSSMVPYHVMTSKSPKLH